MRHLMHEHIVQNPFWHIKKLVREPNSTVGRGAASPSSLLVGDKLDDVNLEPALKVPLVKRIKPLPQIIVPVDLIL